MWEYITRHRSQHAGVTPPEPHERTWAGSVPVGMPEFVSELITDAMRQLMELAIEGTLPAASGTELGIVSLNTARSRIDQALYELVLAGRRSGVSYAQMSQWIGITEDVLARSVEDHHRSMTA
ncbi:hypothetical protein [Streptomyces paromomycinus]|uniref:Uncharacterized protein n=1 Tax=Streptomyces paromomycinus TaxID=92743 RepID=A0A401VTG2_STREY|nr:hypothetical protein [Streptomyces paromomycinus]GCD40371.1 hypothetical protein GKJPGBOP_00020 [Streptomyces paromomycinus]